LDDEADPARQTGESCSRRSRNKSVEAKATILLSGVRVKAAV